MNIPDSAVKAFFEHLYSRYNTLDYIGTDPIKFSHELSGNTEFIAFTSALFAYGNVKAIQKFLHSFFKSSGTDPLKLKSNPDSLKYRFQTPADIACYTEMIKRLYADYGSIEAVFQESGEKDIYKATVAALTTLREKYLPKNVSHGLNFLFAMPGKSASKRLAMYLRWMVRKDEVDLGLWKSFPKTSLSMPLDTHIHRMSLNLGIIASGDSPVKALAKVNRYFKGISPEDPVKYDFALTRKGIAFQCSYSPSKLCKGCGDNLCCVFN